MESKAKGQVKTRTLAKENRGSGFDSRVHIGRAPLAFLLIQILDCL